MAILDYSVIHRTINGQGMILDTTPGNPTEGSYVTEQDILEYAAENTVTQGYLHENVFYSDAGHTIPITANVRFIYIDLHTNGLYRWSGTMYSRLIPVDILTTANVIDDLISTSTTAPLSANMGKELKDTKADKVSSATNGDIAALDASGNIVDSGISGSSVSEHLSNTTIHVTSSDKTTWNAKYDKPSTGIPYTDLASSVQTSLGKADTALQPSDVVNNLSSTESQKPLSAYQGNVLKGEIDGIDALIPSQATSSNQLADKAFVNSTVGTNTSNYISNNGQPFTSVAQLEAYSGTVTNNDYAFVTGTDSSGNTYYDRYKASVSGSTVTWALEYRLNNSSFTSVQWDAISSGITAALVSSYSSHIADGTIHVTSENKTTWNAKYDKPSGGIPSTDMTSAVQTSLGKADSALQDGDAIPPYSVDATAWDTTPTENSTKPVTSGGVYAAIQAGGGGGGGTFTVQITDGTNTGTATLLVDSETTQVPLPANIRATTFTATSARSKKDNISPTTIKALELISKVDIVDFTFKDDEDKWKRVGFIADDTDPILSTPNKDSMDIYNCVGVLMKAVQELYALVKE